MKLSKIYPVGKHKHPVLNNPKNSNPSKPTQSGTFSTHTDENCSIVLDLGFGSDGNTPFPDLTLIFDTKADTADIRNN